MDQDSTTWTGARAPGVERRMSLAWRCSTEQVVSDSERRTHAAAESTKDGSKPASRDGHAGSQLNRSAIREGPSDRPALEPYWGKPTVRNLRGDRGDVGHSESRSAPRSHPTKPCTGLTANHRRAATHGTQVSKHFANHRQHSRRQNQSAGPARSA